MSILKGLEEVRYTCNGCASKDALFETSSNFQDHASSSISMCVQVAFIVAGCTHAAYHRTLTLALGIQAVCMKTFLKTIDSLHAVTLRDSSVAILNC